MIRWALAALGTVCLALGVIGIFLPVLPTVPFLLLASICYARSSPRLHAWMMNHPQLGPPLRDWQRTKSLPLSVKVLAISMIAVSAGFSVFFLLENAILKGVVGVTCSVVAVYLGVGIPTRR